MSGLASPRLPSPLRDRRSPLGAWCVALALLLAACGEARTIDIDPSVVQRPLPRADTPIDTALARAGAEVYRNRCVACHRLEDGVAAGPNLRGVTERRDPEWIRGMVLSPDSMFRTDSIAQALLRQYAVPMIDTRIGEPAFRAVLEYLRTQTTAPPPS